jgi:hypothetical protein
LKLPSAEFPNGQCSSVLVNIDPMFNWPRSGISGEINLIFKNRFFIICYRSHYCADSPHYASHAIVNVTLNAWTKHVFCICTTL